jgi:hypothetical protein
MPHPTNIPSAADLRLCVLARFCHDRDTTGPIVALWADGWDRIAPGSGLGDAMRDEMARLAAWDGEERSCQVRVAASFT